ncbi:MAG: zinc-binding dehydrogenase [Bradyrhizobium sp.]|nr:zinc-binding dehydrogenase [Bradyrhizobium sp.]
MKPPALLEVIGFPFSDAVAAFRYYEAGRAFGKVVVTIP